MLYGNVFCGIPYLQTSLSNLGDKTSGSVALYRFIQCNTFRPAGAHNVHDKYRSLIGNTSNDFGAMRNARTQKFH